jgi:hypothetical protein
VVIAYMSGTNNIDNGVRIVDVTGDGLPDFLQCELSSTIHIYNTNAIILHNSRIITSNSRLGLIGIITLPTCPCINP